MIPVPVGELADLLGVRLTTGDPAALVTSVVADSRQVAPGALFVALAGARVDGHDHVPGSVGQGAVAALTSRDVPGAPCLVVEDALAALGRIARHVVDLAGVVRGSAALQVVGITGSQGKTSTKDLLAQVLEAAGPTVAPVGNLNNELGVPLTACRVEPGTRFLAAELGARGIGHIAYLCQIVAPRVGVVLNVGQAHVGEFGGQPAIAQAKGELVEALPADGCAVLNADDPLVWAMRSRTRAEVLAFSVRAAPDGPGLWASDLAADRLGRHRFRLHARTAHGAEDHAEVALRLTGRHQVANAVAAAAAAIAVGLELGAVADALSRAGARSRWRMELVERPDGVVVVNDAYNANPDSMRAAVTTLAELGRASGGRTWAVLGDMLELGPTASREHEDLGHYLVEQQVSGVFAVGDHASEVVAGAVAAGADPASLLATTDKQQALAAVLAVLAPGDVVLVKASRGLALDTVAEALTVSAGSAVARDQPADRSEGTRVKTIVFAGSLALLGTLLGTRLAIRVLVRKGYGQLIRDDGPTSHHVKRGTPTMGGLVIIAAVLVAYFGSHLLTWTIPSASAMLVLFLFAGLGVVGFLDDYIKISKQRSLGLRSKAKIAGQSIVAIIFALLALQFPDERGITPASRAISFLRDVGWLDGLPIVLVVIWVMLLIAAASNGVNLTDGLDGLAAGACVMIFGAYALINIWQYNQSCAYTASAGPKCYEVRDPYDLAVVAIALAGACFGFLWWNAEPAKIFMGDTGSLSLGGALAGMAIFTRTELLLIILGGLLVIEVMSVILQTSYFKLTRRITGTPRRLFKMTPFHHHFELLNWAQVTIVMRFWIIAGLFVSAGLGIFYAEWVAGT